MEKEYGVSFGNYKSSITPKKSSDENSGVTMSIESVVVTTALQTIQATPAATSVFSLSTMSQTHAQSCQHAQVTGKFKFQLVPSLSLCI